MRRFHVCLALFAALLAPVQARGEKTADPPRMPGAVEAVGAGVEVERLLLEEDLVQLRAAALRRIEAATQAAEVYEAFDRLMRTDQEANSARLEGAREAVDAAERERQEAVEAEREILDRVIERKRRIVLLELRLADLESRTGEAAGPLTAAWDVTMMPSGQKGRMVLTQNGALVSGTYAMDGGWSGSLRGTLVNRKVLLERIDARVGRWGTLEGYLSSDGQSIRGTWSRMELAGLEGAEGQWIASRSGGDTP